MKRKKSLSDNPHKIKYLYFNEKNKKKKSFVISKKKCNFAHSKMRRVV